jgi:hypothetical protein
VLDRLLRVILADRGGPEIFTDPDDKPVLDGGMALLAGEEVIVRPTCCSDLSNLADWYEAAAHREAAWKMLWIGHPWLSVRYDAPWLVASDLHESNSPTARWAVDPDDLQRAALAAEQELGAFATRLCGVLDRMSVRDAERNARRMVGLTT